MTKLTATAILAPDASRCWTVTDPLWRPGVRAFGSSTTLTLARPVPLVGLRWIQGLSAEANQLRPLTSSSATRAAVDPMSAESRTSRGETANGVTFPPSLPERPSNLLIRQPFTNRPASSTTRPAANEITTGPNEGGSLRGEDFTRISAGGSRNNRAKYRKGLEPPKIPFSNDYRLEFGLPTPRRRARIEASHGGVLGRKAPRAATPGDRSGAPATPLGTATRDRYRSHSRKRLLLV